MDQATITRYQPGGDIYAQLAAQYGATAAGVIAAAATTGDETNVNAALVNIKYGQPLDTSTADLFYDQVTTDPLAAPLAGLNTLLSNSFFSFLKNPFVLAGAALALFFLFGGANFIRAKIK